MPIKASRVPRAATHGSKVERKVPSKPQLKGQTTKYEQVPFDLEQFPEEDEDKPCVRP